jgi:hypothetical protein
MARGYRGAMSQTPPGPARDDEDDGPATTPFDNPFFLPVLLWVFTAWFFYDGWFNDKMEWVKFNQWGFAVAGVLAVYYTVRGLRERREDQQRRRESSD